MKKLIKLFVIVLFLSFLTYFIQGIIKKSQEKGIAQKNISTLPDFTFLTLTDTPFNSRTIINGPLLVIRFHPECEHCKYELSEISRSNIPGSGTKILLITSSDRNSVVKFLEPLNFLGDDNVIPLLDTAHISGRLFGSEFLPSHYIYNKDLMLVKTLQGEYKTESILKYLEESE